MSGGVKQLFHLRNICVKELKLVQTNLETYLKDMTEFALQWKTDMKVCDYFQSEYESFVANLSSMIDLARKFNLQIQIINMNLSKLHSTISKVKQSSKLYFRNTCSNIFLREPRLLLYPAVEHDRNVETSEFIYPKLNLRTFYEKGLIIDGAVTFIENLTCLKFYIVDKYTEFRHAIVRLFKSFELQQYQNIPPAEEIFGCVIDNHIFRAVRSSKLICDSEVNADVIPCYLLDTGEMFSMKSDNIMYKLTHDQKTIPGLALPCRLNTKIKNQFSIQEELEKILKQFEYNNCKLKIIAIEDTELLVEFVENQKIIQYKNKDNDDKTANFTNFSKIVPGNKSYEEGLTKEIKEILYEEIISTNSVMKAVMDHDPQDERRICRFYNNGIGACFKGIRCKMEHKFHQENGWTKDVLPTASIIDNCCAITAFTRNSIINITPTYITSLDRFYAQINDYHQIKIPLVWNDEDVPQWKILQTPPYVLELVLCRYVDGLWYRAKIVSHDDNYQMFKVFYVDYGNHHIVHLSNLAAINLNQAQLPFQAVLCKIDGFHKKLNITEEERQKCIHLLCKMILNKSIDVVVKAQYEDLCISFANKNDYPIPDILLNL